MSASPLRHNGLYRFRDRAYMALHLATHDEAWESTALVTYPLIGAPFGMLYLRHADNVLLDYRDFERVGTLADLEDTGRDEAPL